MEVLPQYLLLEMLAGALSLLLVLWMLGKGRRQKAGPLAKRMEFADAAKGAAMLGVIAIHAGTLASWGEPYKEIFGFAVPLFILLSGYLLARRYASKLEAGKYLKSVFFRIALVYAIFVLALHLLHNNYSINPLGLAQDFFLGRADNGSFYFIPLIIQLYLIFPFIRNNRAVLSVAGLIAIWCISLYANYATWSMEVPVWNANQAALAFFGRCAFFFVFGMWLAGLDLEKLGAKRSAAAGAVLLAASAALSALNGNIYLGYLFTIAVFFLLHSAFQCFRGALEKYRIVSALSAMGRNSLAIYMVHASVIFGLLSRLPYDWGGPVGYVALVACAAAISYLAAGVFMAAYNRATAGFRA